LVLAAKTPMPGTGPGMINEIPLMGRQPPLASRFFTI
jgi:hypothetical protein